MYILPPKVLHLHLEEAKKKPKISGNYMITEKIDGWFGEIYFFPETGWSDIYTSSGRALPSMIWSKDSIWNRLPKPKVACKIIFEMSIDGMEFAELNGVFNRTKGDCQAWDTIFNLHDFVPLSQQDVASPTSANDRYQHLLKWGFKPRDNFKIIPLLDISPDKNVWMKHFDNIVSNGGEGIVLKQSIGYYLPGRKSFMLMKIKAELDVDLLCINVFTSIGEKNNIAYNLLCKSSDGVEISVRLGKDTDILLYQQDSSNFIGKIMEIKGMLVLPDGKIREPRFYRRRLDKTTADSLKDKYKKGEE